MKKQKAKKSKQPKRNPRYLPVLSSEYDFDKVTLFIIFASIVFIVGLIKIAHITSERSHIKWANRKLSAIQTQLENDLPNGKLERKDYCVHQPDAADPDKNDLYCGVELTGSYPVRSLITAQTVQQKISTAINNDSALGHYRKNDSSQLYLVSDKDLQCGYAADLPSLDTADGIWLAGQRREVNLKLTCTTKATVQYYRLEKS